MATATPDTPETEVLQLHGLKMPIDRRLMSDRIVESIRLGRYEMGEAHTAPRMVRDGERVVEVGAGLGVLTAVIATRTRAELVVAIEANPQVQDYIADLHRLNGAHTEIVQALVTPEPAGETGRLFLHEDLWASSPAWFKRRNQVGVVKVPALSLPAIAERWRPTMLIVDVEPFVAWADAEGPPDALAGADFRPFERVLLELKPKRFDLAKLKRVFDHFSAQGFAYSTAHSAGPVVLFERIPA